MGTKSRREYMREYMQARRAVGRIAPEVALPGYEESPEDLAELRREIALETLAEAFRGFGADGDLLSTASLLRLLTERLEQ